MSLSACPVRAGEERSLRVHPHCQIRQRNVSMSSARIGSRASRVLLQNMTTVGARIELHHHRADDADAVLDVVNALRFAPTRPVAGPSGIDDASARHRWAMTRWWVDLMRRTTRLTTASRGRMLGSSPQCRTALLRFATTASGARIRPTLPGHGFERTLHDIAVRYAEPLAVPRSQDHAPPGGSVHQWHDRALV